MNGQLQAQGSKVTVTSASVTLVLTSSIQSMADLPVPPQAHQHISQASVLPPPVAHQQVLVMQPQLLPSGSSSPQGCLSPARHSPSPARHSPSPARHSPSPRSPGSPGALSLLYPGGSPIPLTVAHTSPIGKHGGTLGALTASVNALQRPISTAGLHTASSYPVVRTTLAPASRISSNPFVPCPGPQAIRATRAPKQRMIMTTKTPIFRSHSVPSTTTAGSMAGSVTSMVPAGMVRVSPSTQAVRAQVQAQAAQVQAHLHAAQLQQQARQIMSQSCMGIPPTSPSIAIRATPTAGPLMRNPNPGTNTAPNPIQIGQAKLQQALLNAEAKYRQRISSPPPMGLVTPSVQARNKLSKSTPNPPAKSQTIKPAPHIPILPKTTPPSSPGYTAILPKPVGVASGAQSKLEKPKPQQKKLASKPRSQFKPMQGHSSEVRLSSKPAATLPTATVSATATVLHKVTKVTAGKETPDLAVRPELSVRPEVTTRRPEVSVRPEFTVRPEMTVMSEVTVMSDVVTIKENGCMEKEIPRAIVRPQVLTHVIDGFIIEESKEPFPVSHPTEVIEVIPEPHKHKPHKQQSKSSKTRHSQREEAPRNDNSNLEEEEDCKVLLRCEFCGQMAPKRKFRGSKRFCSMSCAKRYNVGCSKRLGLFSPKRDNPERIKHLIKLQTKAKPLKGSRGKHGRLSFNVNQPWSAGIGYADDKSWIDNVPHSAAEPPKPLHQQQQHLERTDSTTSSSSSSNGQSVSEETSSISAPVPSPEVSEPDMSPASDDAFEDPQPGTSTTDPGTWSVQEVYEFIRRLPTCESYAEEFQRQEIDGQALLLLKEDHLMTAMNMKLGPALKIISRINSLKDK